RVAQGLPLAGLEGRARRARPRRLPLDAVLRLRRLHRLLDRARGRVRPPARRRQPGHVAARRAHEQRRSLSMRIRLRFRKLGKIRFTSHRDVARIWERALRRASLPVAYSEGFSPRPKLSFGLALSTGHESLGEYLDIDLAEPVDVDSVATRLDPCLPVGLDVQTAAEIPPG